MGKYDVDLKCSEIRKLIKDKKYDKAFEIMQEIDIMHVKSVMDYKAFYEVYSSLKRYDDAKEMLIRMYQRTSSKRVLYQLVCLAVRSGKLDEAESSYEDFLNHSSESEDRFILRYLIDKAKHADYDKRIVSLEQLKKCNYYEEWAYELAKLYHKAGRKEDCIKECKDIILWFGEGTIVEKAKMLKRYYENGDVSFLEVVTEKKKTAEREKWAQKAESDTVDLANQIRNIKEIEVEQKLRDELNQELSNTTDVNKAIVKEQYKVNFDLKSEIESVKHKIRDTKPIELTKNLSEKITKELDQVILEQEKKKEEPKQEENAVIVRGKNISAVFGKYLESVELKNQIIQCLEQINTQKGNPYVMVTTENAEGGLEFIKKLAKALEKLEVIKKSQVARIKGENLNYIKLEQRTEKLRNSVLLVEGASSLYLPTIRNLTKLMDELKGELVVIFEDTKENMKVFREEHYELNNSNLYTINL